MARSMAQQTDVAHPPQWANDLTKWDSTLSAPRMITVGLIFKIVNTIEKRDITYK